MSRLPAKHLDFPMLDDKKALGLWIKAIREAAGLTQVQLGAIVRTDGPHVIAWEKGRHAPNGMKLIEIMRACGVKIVASKEPPQVSRPTTTAELTGAIESLAAQMAALVAAASRIERLEEDDGAPDQEEASG